MEGMTVSILGCGWLGIPLAEKLLERGYPVKGSSTREEKLPELRGKGIEAYRVQVGESLEGKDLESFFDSELLIINIPPERRRSDLIQHHPAQIGAILEQAQKGSVQNLLFVSSSSVYPSVNREVREDEEETPDKDSGKALRKAEEAVFEAYGDHATVLRLSGLVGYERMPGRFLANKKEVKNGEAPVNLIHQDDCVGLTIRIIEGGHWGKVYNGAAPEHPLRKDFYKKAAQKAGLIPPSFADDEEPPSYKIVDGSKAREELDYSYAYPDPMGMIQEPENRNL